MSVTTACALAFMALLFASSAAFADPQAIKSECIASSFGTPQSLMLLVQGSSIKAEWQAPAEAAGCISYYQVVIRDANGQVGSPRTYLTQSKNIRLQGLEAARTYEVAVVAVNVPGQPLEFTAVPMSEEAVHLTWMPPAYPINACIDKYRLDVMETSTGNRMQEVYISSDKLNTTIGRLKPGSKYRFTITSTAAAGSSLGAVMFTTMPLSNQQLATEERSHAGPDVGASSVTDVPATSQTSISRTAYNPFGPGTPVPTPVDPRLLGLPARPSRPSSQAAAPQQAPAPQRAPPPTQQPAPLPRPSPAPKPKPRPAPQSTPDPTATPTRAPQPAPPPESKPDQQLPPATLEGPSQPSVEPPSRPSAAPTEPHGPAAGPAESTSAGTKTQGAAPAPAQSTSASPSADKGKCRSVLSPGEPIYLRATAVNDTKLRISWTNSNPYICVDKYVVSGVNTKGAYPVFFATTNATEVVAAGLLPGRWYEFKVVAKNSAGDARSATILTSIPE